MDSSELFIQALRRLVDRTAGGLTEVSERAGVSEDNLKQILAGTKLKSGRPRGIGPNLRNRIDQAFPGWWLDSATMVIDGTTVVVKSVGTMLVDLAGQLVHTDELTRRAMTPLIERLLAHPEEASSIAPRVEALIAAEPSKPYVTTPVAEVSREQQELRTAPERARKGRPSERSLADIPESSTTEKKLKRPITGH